MEMDIVFESGLYSAAMSISGSQFTAMMLDKQKLFDKRYYQLYIFCYGIFLDLKIPSH